jgi:hypothetical protein
MRDAHAILPFMNKAVAIGLLFGLAVHQGDALARGVTPYLPVNLEPEIERQIERVLILGDQPVLQRPIAAATVLEALPRACEIDAVTCVAVRRYLSRFMSTSGITHLSVQGASASGEQITLPNQYGERSDSSWGASASLYWHPSSYLLINLGGVAYDDDAVAQGSVVSIGTDRLQIDVGYRAHWLSPSVDSSMLLGTQAPTMLSATVSNYRPFTRFRLKYQAFAARMSESDRIRFQDEFVTGRPKLAGLHVSIEPAPGFALGINRLLQFGGGGRPDSLGDFLEAFFAPSRVDNQDFNLDPNDEFGNQLASITSRILFPGRNPFAVYFEYAGEDTSAGKNFLLGNSALTAGIHFARLGQALDLTLEMTEWQNGWYAHHIYQDGLINKGTPLGHWAVTPNVGGISHMARLGWEPPFGGVMELRYRTSRNETYTPVQYERAHDVMLRYSRSWRYVLFGAELSGGSDVLGEDFTRVALFARMSVDGSPGIGNYGEGFPSYRAEPDSLTDVFVSAGVSGSRVRVDLDNDIPTVTTSLEAAPYVAIGARRKISEQEHLGARLELTEVDGHLLLAVRAIDYRYQFRGPLAVSGFLGAARYDLATPAYGIYGGAGIQWSDVLPGWDLGFDLSCAFNVARDDLLPSDPAGGRPDSFFDIYNATLSITRRF